jgi:limonene-1,2-epoxide hydrolase
MGWVDVIVTGIISVTMMAILLWRAWREEHQPHQLPR